MLEIERNCVGINIICDTTKGVESKFIKGVYNTINGSVKKIGL